MQQSGRQHLATCSATGLSRRRRWARGMICLAMLASLLGGYLGNAYPVVAQTTEQQGTDGETGEATPEATSTAAKAPTGVSPALNDAAAHKGMIWRAEDRWVTEDGYDWAGIESDLRAMQEAGAGWVRIAFKQDMPLSFYDCLLPLVEQYGLQVLGNTRKTIEPKELGTPEQQEAYRAWLVEVVTRYQDDVRYWEIENETNIPSGWNICLDANCDESDPAIYSQAVADYVSLLQIAYETIKSVDPTIQVLIGGLCECGAERYIDELIKLEAYRFFDIMAFHPFGRSPEEVMQRFDAIKAKLAEQPELAAKPIWITAIGFHTADWPGTPGRVANEEIKAEYLLQTFQLLREAEGVAGPIFWYVLAEPVADVNGYGLMAKAQGADPSEMIKLPAYTAYQELWVTKQVGVLPALEDSFVSQASPTINYGGSQLLRIGSGTDSRQAYAKFDFSGLHDVTLLQTQLRFLTSNEEDAGSTDSQTIRLLDGVEWSETGLTFDNQPVIGSVLSTTVGVISNTVAGQGYQVELDATTLQQAIGQEVSLMIDSQSEDELILQSREWKSSLKLIVYYATEPAEPAMQTPAEPTTERLPVAARCVDGAGSDAHLYLPFIE